MDTMIRAGAYASGAEELLSPSEVLKRIGLRQARLLMAFAFGGVVITAAAAVYLCLRSQWEAYLILGLGIPLALEALRRIMIDLAFENVAIGFDRCVKEHGSPLVLKYALKADNALDWIAFLLLGSAMTFVTPFIALSVFTLLGIPVGLRILEHSSLGDYYSFLAWGGLVPGAWLVTLVMLGGMLLKVCSDSKPDHAQQEDLFPVEQSC